MTTHYLNSKGQRVLIADMDYSHLVNAHAKLERDADVAGPDAPRRYLEQAAMADEIKLRDDRMAHQRRELEREGVYVLGDGEDATKPWYACTEGGDEVLNTRSRDENGAWMRAWTALRP